MAKFRVYEIAKKYNKDNKEILEIFKNFYLYSLKESQSCRSEKPHEYHRR